MPFDWKRAIERNTDDLLAIVTRLFVLAGLRTGRSVTMLPHGLILATGGEAKTHTVILGLDPRIHGWRTHSLQPEQDRSSPD